MNGADLFKKIFSDFNIQEKEIDEKQKQVIDKPHICYCIVCHKNFRGKNRGDLFCSNECFKNSKI